MSSNLPNPFLTSNRPCMCGSKKVTRECCGPRRSVHLGEAEALRNIGPPLPVIKSYGSFLAAVIKLYLHRMYPAEAANIEVILVNLDDKEFRSRAIVTREDGQFGRTLFTGSKGHDTPEASAEALLFMIIQHIARGQGEPVPSRQEFDAKVKANWQEKQEQTKREAQTGGQSIA